MVYHGRDVCHICRRLGKFYALFVPRKEVDLVMICRTSSWIGHSSNLMQNTLYCAQRYCTPHTYL